MRTLQENQSLNAEYERNQKERLLQEKVAEYEDTDSVLAQYTISNLHHRINKAIEYIENPRHEMSVKSYQELLKILKGE